MKARLEAMENEQRGIKDPQVSIGWKIFPLRASLGASPYNEQLEKFPQFHKV